MHKSSNTTLYSRYFHVHILKPEKTWLLSAEIKSVDHLAFDRAFNGQPIFEFFVPDAMVPEFHKTMDRLKSSGVIGEVVELPNRFKE